MDKAQFDHLSKQLAAGSRRTVLGAVAAMVAAAGVAVAQPAEARRQRGVHGETFNHRKATYCLHGETIRRYRRKQEKLLANGATIGRCQPSPPPPPCGDSCAGCCTGETCQAGNTQAACGANGAACAVCADGQACLGQTCCVPNGDVCCTPNGGVCNLQDPGACCSKTCFSGQPNFCG